MNISSSESQADSVPAAVTEEAVMSGVADASLDDMRRLCQSSDISIESLRSALNHFCPSDLSKRVRVLSDLCNNQHASDEILQCATEFFTRGEDEAISWLIVRACNEDKSNVVTFLLDKYPSVVEYVHEFRHEGEDYKIPTLRKVLFGLSNKDVALGVLNKLLDERLEFVRNVRLQPTGDTLLHLAAKHIDARSTEICRTLLQKIPELLSGQNNEANRPFEEACFYDNRSVVECILDSNPAVVENDLRGMPVLFRILHLNVIFFVLHKLLESNPEIVRNIRSSDDYDYTLLHWIAAIAKVSDMALLTEILSILIETFPSLLNKRCSQGRTPLHKACDAVSLTLVKCILEKSPDAIHNTTSGGLTPIMCVICPQNLIENPKDTIELTQYLLDFHPSTASFFFKSCYPLTLILMMTEEPYLNAGLKVIKLIYDAFPQALILQQSFVSSSIEDGTIDNAVASFVTNQLHFLRLTSDAQLLTTPEDDSGNLPLHTALRRSRNISFGTIKYMVEKSPLTIHMPNENGSLPLHFACTFHGCPKVAQYLLKHDKRSLFIANHDGDTPLHCACRAAKHDIITMIFSEYSNAPVATNDLNGELPIDLLLSVEDKESAGFLGSLYLLIRADPHPEPGER